DDHSLDRRYNIVTGKWIFPRLQGWMTHFCLDQVHLANAALVLLEGSDLLRIGRPEKDRAVAPDPTSVVRRVAEILDTIRGELLFLASRNIANPQVPIADKGGELLVGGERLVASPRTTAAGSSAGWST